MTYANGCIEVSEAPFYQFIEMDPSEVVVAEKRMFGEDGFEAERLRRHKNDMLENTDTLVAMNDVNLFTNQDLTD